MTNDDTTLPGLAYDSIDTHAPDGRLKDFRVVDEAALATCDTLRRLARS